MEGNTGGLSCLLPLCHSTVISTAHICLTSDQLSLISGLQWTIHVKTVVRITMATVAEEHQGCCNGNCNCNSLQLITNSSVVVI